MPPFPARSPPSAPHVAERHLIEAGRGGAEAVEIFLLPAGGDGRQRAAVEGALEGDQPVALGVAIGRMILARGLDGAFQRFRTRIGEENVVGKGQSR
jgi:hypothetical protein